MARAEFLLTPFLCDVYPISFSKKPFPENIALATVGEEHGWMAFVWLGFLMAMKSLPPI